MFWNAMPLQTVEGVQQGFTSVGGEGVNPGKQKKECGGGGGEVPA